MSLGDDARKTAHLLRRFGLGASEAEVDDYARGGYRAAVERLLAFDSVVDPHIAPDSLGNSPGRIPVPAAKVWWHARLLTTQRPLEHALTLFWHHHFATSVAKVDVGPVMVEHVETLRKHCAGPFLDLLTAVSKDPAMLYWLDNHLNAKDRPNENFARELLELFTLGIGQYTEEDVRETARAFTGWTYSGPGGNRGRDLPKPRRGSRFRFAADRHDGGPKTILGESGPLDGDDVLRALARRPETALFLVRKFWEWFVHPDPDPAVVDRFAREWQVKGLRIGDLVRSVALSPEFVSDRAFRAVVKNPVHFCVSTLRQLGVGRRLTDELRVTDGDPARRRRAFAPAAFASQAARSMGMDLLAPPDVAGWNVGQAWVTTATMVERMKWAGRLFGGAGGPSLNVPVADVLPSVRTADGLVDGLLSLFDAELEPSKRSPLVAAARDALAGGVTRTTLQDAARTSARLLFGSPEFQFA